MLRNILLFSLISECVKSFKRAPLCGQHDHGRKEVGRKKGIWSERCLIIYLMDRYLPELRPSVGAAIVGAVILLSNRIEISARTPTWKS